MAPAYHWKIGGKDLVTDTPYLRVIEAKMPQCDWFHWTDTSTTTNIAITYDTKEYVWHEWVNASNSTTSNWYKWNDRDVQVAKIDSRIAEEIRIGNERNRRIRALRYRQIGVLRKKAEERAEQLLLSLLDKDQTEEYRKHGTIHVNSQHGRRYCLTNRKHHSVFEVNEKGERVREVCTVARNYDIPVADDMAARLLGLKYNEDYVLEHSYQTDLLVVGRR